MRGHKAAAEAKRTDGGVCRGAEARAEGSARAVAAATPVLPSQKPKRKATRAPAAPLRVHVYLEVLAKSGTDQDREHAAKILPVVKNQHRLLCTLLIYNAAAMEALPIFLDSLVTAWDAILISATSILLFGVILILILLLMEKWWTRTEKGSSYFSASLPEYKTSASMQFAAPVKMGIYNRPPPLGMWNNEAFRVDSNQTTSGCMIMEADTKFDTRIEEVPQVALEAARSIDQEASKPPDKVLKRLAQNREAARKSRLRKKAYVQQLETSRMKLAQLEQELQQARQQGVYVSGGLGDSPLGLAGSIDPGVAAFEIEYNHWVDEQNRHTGELRTALQGQTTELELRMLVETGLSNYDHLFRIKAIAANSDVFYIMSGMWKTPAERFFLWLGGFRPSEVLKILSPQLEPLTDQQVVAVCGLQQTSTQAEDALLQGMEKLQQTLAEALVATDPFGSSDMVQMATAVEKLKALACFVVQADHLRQTTLQQMHKILTTRQAARGLLALGDYFQRLRALSSLWATRPCEPAISKM